MAARARAAICGRAGSPRLARTRATCWQRPASWSRTRCARLAASPEDRPRSTAGTHLCGRDDDLVTVAPLPPRVGEWRAFPAGGLDEARVSPELRHRRVRPKLGSRSLIIAGRTVKASIRPLHDR
jgi:hypothetical protein